MTWTEPTRCALCGNLERRDLAVSLVHWLEAPLGMAYEHVERCRDREACRARVLAQGDVWPLAESERKASA